MSKQALAWLVGFFVVVSSSAAAMFPTQNGAPEEVRKAQALVQAKDYDGAIKILEEFLKSQAGQPRPGAWNILADGGF